MNCMFTCWLFKRLTDDQENDWLINKFKLTDWLMDWCTDGLMY